MSLGKKNNSGFEGFVLAMLLVFNAGFLLNFGAWLRDTNQLTVLWAIFVAVLDLVVLAVLMYLTSLIKPHIVK